MAGHTGYHQFIMALIKDQFTQNPFKCIRRDGIMLDQCLEPIGLYSIPAKCQPPVKREC